MTTNADIIFAEHISTAVLTLKAVAVTFPADSLEATILNAAATVVSQQGTLILAGERASRERVLSLVTDEVGA